MQKSSTKKKYCVGDPLEKLPQEKKKNGYIYKLEQRSNHAAIYKQFDLSTLNEVGFEVFKINISNPVTLVNKQCNTAYDYPAKEKFPCNEDFGKTAWTFNTIDPAIKFFEEINLSATNK